MSLFLVRILISKHHLIVIDLLYYLLLPTTIFMASQLLSKEAKRINAWISSSNSIFTKDDWFVIILNSFICCTTRVPYALFKLNNFFIRCTFLLIDNFLYMPDKIFIKFIVVFSSTTLYETNLDRVNWITLNPVY